MMKEVEILISSRKIDSDFVESVKVPLFLSDQLCLRREKKHCTHNILCWFVSGMERLYFS